MLFVSEFERSIIRSNEKGALAALRKHNECPNPPPTSRRGRSIIPLPLLVYKTERKFYMNILKAHDFKGKKVIDSREVAEMVDKQHKNLLADIRGYISVMESSGELKFQPSDFFIPHTFVNAQNKEMPCFLITKKGCDMIANKLTGKKGVLFTAAYVTAFEEMAEQLKADHVPPRVSPGGVAQLINVTRRIMMDCGDTPQDIRKMETDMLETWRIPVPLTLQQPAQLNLFSTEYQAIAGGEQA